MKRWSYASRRYSLRRARIGSILAARRAGIQQASTAYEAPATALQAQEQPIETQISALGKVQGTLSSLQSALSSLSNLQGLAQHEDIYARIVAERSSLPKAVQARISDWHAQLEADTVAVAHGGTARALLVALGLETPVAAADFAIAQGVVYVFGNGGLTKYG